MLLGKLRRRYWPAVQVLRIASRFSATLWTHFEYSALGAEVDCTRLVLFGEFSP